MIGDRDKTIYKNIERLGERYYKKHLEPWSKNLENDWWKALKFFLGHSFMRGRRDELSVEYYDFTVKSLEEHFFISKGNLEESYKKLKEKKDRFKKEGILNFRRGKGIRNSVSHEDFWSSVAEKNEIIKLLATHREVRMERENKIEYKDTFT